MWKALIQNTWWRLDWKDFMVLQHLTEFSSTQIHMLKKSELTLSGTIRFLVLISLLFTFMQTHGEYSPIKNSPFKNKDLQPWLINIWFSRYMPIHSLSSGTCIVMWTWNLMKIPDVCPYTSSFALQLIYIHWSTFPPYYRHVYDNFWLSNTLLMKGVTNNNWCPSAIHKVMDGSPHRRCWEISRDACCVCWIWCIYKGPWLQCVISEHPSQHSVSDHLELYKEWREWGWESFVAAFPWRDRLHGWWVCNCPIKISFNIKDHIRSVCKTFEVQLTVFLEMPLGLQEEACIGDIRLPWWSVNLNMKKKRPKYGGKRKQIDYSDINQYVNATTWIWTWILKTLYK